VRISDIMHSGQALPLAGPTATLAEVIVEMTRCRLGFCALTDAHGRVAGVITDGDLRRNIERITEARDLLASEIMSVNPQCIEAEAMAVAAAEHMQRHKIQGLVVVDAEQRPIGALNFQDLLQAGVV
jgi:arabinose-5-phosphate isomerase